MRLLHQDLLFPCKKNIISKCVNGNDKLKSFYIPGPGTTGPNEAFSQPVIKSRRALFSFPAQLCVASDLDKLSFFAVRWRNIMHCTHWWQAHLQEPRLQDRRLCTFPERKSLSQVWQPQEAVNHIPALFTEHLESSLKGVITLKASHINAEQINIECCCPW